MKTELTTVNGTMYVYAIPKTEYEIEKLDDNELPFSYVLRSFDFHSDDDAVRVCEFPCTGVVPAGIDLVMQAITGMKERQLEIQKEADRKISRLETRIKALALIEYKPAEQAADGDALRKSDDVPFE